MYYNFSRKELKEKNGKDFKEGDIINITDSHFEIWISYKAGTNTFNSPSLCSKVFDINKSEFQDVVFRQTYINNFLHR